MSNTTRLIAFTRPADEAHAILVREALDAHRRWTSSEETLEEALAQITPPASFREAIAVGADALKANFTQDTYTTAELKL